MPIDALGGSLPGRTVRLVGTVLAILAVLVLYRGVYASGGRLKERFSGPAVEAGQGLVGLVITLVGMWFILDIWSGTGEVLSGGVTVGETATIRLVVTLGMLVGAYLFTRLTKRFIQAIFEGDRVSVHQREIGHHVVQVTTYAVALLFVLALWEVPLGRLLIGAGAATIVVGLAARQTLGSVFAGFVLLFSRPFEIGDWVVVGDKEGIVRDVNIVKTQLRTFDDEQVMIPNDMITGSEIVNRSRQGRLRVTTEVRIDYGTDVQRAIEAAEEALRGLDAEPMVDDPAPQVVARRLEESAIILELRVWIDEPSAGRKWAVRTAMADAVTSRFQAAGIAIPFPQREFSARSSGDVGSAAEQVAPDGAGESLLDADLSPEEAAALASMMRPDAGEGAGQESPQ
jgi:small conductance mechanosensitive channel